jgi:hypothetical protein
MGGYFNRAGGRFGGGISSDVTLILRTLPKSKSRAMVSSECIKWSLKLLLIQATYTEIGNMSIVQGCRSIEAGAD